MFSGGIDPINRTWVLHVGGFFAGSEVQVPKDGPSATIPLAALAWGPELGEEFVLIPNLPIPVGETTIRYELRSKPLPGLRWLVEVGVGEAIKKP